MAAGVCAPPQGAYSGSELIVDPFKRQQRMAERQGRVKPWRPGELLEGESSAQDVLNTISFVRQDLAFTKIGEKLAARNCITVDDLAAYTSVEFCALAKSICDLKHKARVYQAAIETVIERKLDADSSIKSELDGRRQTGGDMSTM